MTPKQAEAILIARKQRVSGNKGGAESLAFSKQEREAIRHLAAQAHSQGTIANRAGITLAQLKRAFEMDTLLREAYDAGIAEERLKIDQALLKTALDSKNPRQVQSAMSLLKSRHGLTEGGGKSVSVNVNNVLALPSPQDFRKYQSIMKRVTKLAPTVIEHAPQGTPRIAVDPIKAVREKQK